MAEALMISRRELRKQAMRQGVALGALEKDYVLALILERLYSDPDWHETLVFKGGTALNKVYKTQRLSLDLDFTARQPVSVDALRRVLEIPEIQGQIKDVHEYHDALTIDRLGFVGPLQHPNSIKVDISLREEVQVPPRQALVETPMICRLPSPVWHWKRFWLKRSGRRLCAARHAIIMICGSYCGERILT
jgi:predicted nucleotidyltransferase component of viral defense system